LEELDKEVFPAVIPITDEQERLKETNENEVFSGNCRCDNIQNQEELNSVASKETNLKEMPSG